MVSKVIYFLLGVLIATLFCINHFSKLIKQQSVYIENASQQNVEILDKAEKRKFQQGLIDYKALYSEQVRPIIASNIAIIHKIMNYNSNDEQIMAARSLLASSLFLNDMTLQDMEIKEEVFLASALFYKKSGDLSNIDEAIQVLKAYCEDNHIMFDCSESKVKEIHNAIK